MKNPIISIIIPVYNSSLFIKKTINSVLNQTFKNFELIIVDDGSTDNTKGIIEEFIKKDDRVKYFYQKNSGGPSKPKNFGVSKAEGEYIAFLDHDDIWLPTKLEKQYNYFIKHEKDNIGVLGCYVEIFGEENFLIKKSDCCGDSCLLKSNETFPFSCSSIFTKKSLLEKWGGFDQKMEGVDDYDLYIRVVEKGYCIKYVKEVLVKYRSHVNNLSKNKDKQYLDFKKLIEKHLVLLKTNKKIISIFYRKLGTFAFLSNRKKESYEYFLKSFKKSPNVRVFANIIISVIGEKTFNKLLFFKKYFS